MTYRRTEIIGGRPGYRDYDTGIQFVIVIYSVVNGGTE